MKTCIIHQPVRNILVPVGRVDFDEHQVGTLSVTTQNPARAEALRTAWAAISSRAILEWNTTALGEFNGEPVIRCLTKQAKPGSKDYPHAVRDILQREFAYEIDAS